MKLEIVPANLRTDIPALMEMDTKIFTHPGDLWDAEDYERYDISWIKVDGERIGSTELGLHMAFNISAEDEDWVKPGCIYLGGLGILPEFRRKGIGTLVVEWQIDWARNHGFNAVSTNCRESDDASIRLCRKFGLEVAEVVPYHKDPVENTVVMLLKLR